MCVDELKHWREGDKTGNSETIECHCWQIQFLPSPLVLISKLLTCKQILVKAFSTTLLGSKCVYDIENLWGSVVVYLWHIQYTSTSALICNDECLQCTLPMHIWKGELRIIKLNELSGASQSRCNNQSTKLKVQETPERMSEREKDCVHEKSPK